MIRLLAKLGRIGYDFLLRRKKNKIFGCGK
jgi:hypothetical protein